MERKIEMPLTSNPPTARPAAHTTGGCDHAAPTEPARLQADAAQLEAAAAMCQALADPARLRLLLWLAAEGALCVSELVAREGQKLGTVSARLQQLHAARLVLRRREAKHVYYELADAHVRALLDNVIQHAGEAAGL
jgi:ArsR family transcriptional regulator